MCPMCITTTAVLIAGSGIFTGGLAAIGIKRFGAKDAVDNHPVPGPGNERRI